MAESYGERLATEASEMVARAYAWAEASENPYAAALVTQRLGDGNLILLSTARKAVSADA